jgi:hypothetical protein
LREKYPTFFGLTEGGIEPHRSHSKDNTIQYAPVG